MSEGNILEFSIEESRKKKGEINSTKKRKLERPFPALFTAIFEIEKTLR